MHNGQKCRSSWITYTLMFIGGLNWGLAGAGMLLAGGANWNVVNLLLSDIPTAESIVYLIVGIATIASLFGCKCGRCGKCTSCGVDAGAKM